MGTTRRAPTPRGNGAPTDAELEAKLDAIDPPPAASSSLDEKPPAEEAPTVAATPVALAYLLGAGFDRSEFEEEQVVGEAVATAADFLPPLLSQALVVQRLFPQLQLVDLLIGAVMREVGPVRKGQVFEQGNTRYNFRGIDDVTNALAAAVRQAGLYHYPVRAARQLRDAMTTQQRPTREAVVDVVYRFQAPDGTYRDVTVPGESLDQADKGSAKAMSVAYRIALLQLYLLPTTDPDPDSSYLTREGYHGISPSTSLVLRRVIDQAPLAQVLDEAVPVLREHAAWERPCVEGAETTWSQRLGDRIAADIAALRNVDTAKELSTSLKERKAGAYRDSSGKTAVELLRLRWPVLVEEGRKTLDHCMLLILDAMGQDELDAAVTHVRDDREYGALPLKERDELLAVAGDRRAKLPEVAPVPVEQPCADLSVHEPHVDVVRDGETGADGRATVPTRVRCPGRTESQVVEAASSVPWAAADYEMQWAAFQARVAAVFTAGTGIDDGPGRSAIVRDSFAALLANGEWGPPAATFGFEGILAVDDAVKAAHRRDGLLTDEDREHLNHLLVQEYSQFSDIAMDPGEDNDMPTDERY